jgi:uncharacterized membrane protein YeaQ/YmgE (transglycosylase-associated protein family)
VICGAYVVAWLAGLLTPGAPADLLTAIVLGRIVTVFGDVVFYLLAVCIRPRLPQ